MAAERSLHAWSAHPRHRLTLRVVAEQAWHALFAQCLFLPPNAAELQRPNPEWIITGSALVDTTLFARTYDQTQWNHAFGISYLVARSDPHIGDAWRLLGWHNGQEPVAKNQFGVIYAPLFTTFTGFHMAGATLTPQTFQKGLFNYPVTGQGSLTTPTSS